MVEDPHTEPRTTSRFPPDLKAKALANLHAAGWGLNEYLIAALRLLVENPRPREYLDWMTRYRPPERRGRPKKSPD